MTGAELSGLGLPQLWEIVLGILLPLLIATVTRQTWSPGRKTGTMLVAVFVTTVVGELIYGRLVPEAGASWRSWLASLFYVFVLTVTTYRHVWKPTGAAPRLEAATDPSKPADPPASN